MRGRQLMVTGLVVVAAALLVISAACGSDSGGSGSGGHPDTSSQHEPGDTSAHNIPSMHDVEPPYEEGDVRPTEEGSQDSGDGAEVEVQAEITVTADEFSFTPDEITIASGETVMLTLQNEGAVEHDLQVDGVSIERTDGGDMAGDHEGAGEDVLALQTTPGESASLTFRTDQKGTFDFYCAIPGHRDAGMVGKLTVG